MVNQKELDQMYMNLAKTVSKSSRAQRKRVGAILVTPEGGRFEGWNGTPSGFDNCCELENTKKGHNLYYNLRQKYTYCYRCKKEWYGNTRPDTNLRRAIDNQDCTILETKKEVLHAESNAIMKVARSTSSSIGGTLYCTLSPCLECSKLIIQAGIARVVYLEGYPYKDFIGEQRSSGVQLLEEAGIAIEKYDSGDGAPAE